jgi:hypothetical protein
VAVFDAVKPNTTLSGSKVDGMTPTGGATVYPSVLPYSVGSPPTPLPAFRILYATPLDSNTIRVFFSSEPRNSSPLGENDVQLRTNWSISILSGGGTIPVVEKVENVIFNPQVGEPDAWSVDLRLDRRILVKTEYLTVGNSAIESALGQSLPSAPYDRGDHPGITTPRTRKKLKQVAVATGVDFRYSTFDAVYILDSRSDIDVHAGTEVVKKRIIRRIISSPGGFYHLPTYGVGLRAKGPFNSTRVGQIEAKIREQILEEDDVEEVEVRVTVPEPSTLLIRIRAKTSQSQRFELMIEAPEDGQYLVL